MTKIGSSSQLAAPCPSNRRGSTPEAVDALEAMADGPGKDEEHTAQAAGAGLGGTRPARALAGARGERPRERLFWQRRGYTRRTRRCSVQPRMTQGATHMSHQSSLPLIITVGVLWVVTAIGCASKAASPPSSAATTPRATIVSVEGAATAYRTRDWNGQSVTVWVPSQSAADVKGMETKGRVRATVTGIDPTMNHVQVRTAEGQTVVLAMAPAIRKDLRVGDPLLFTLPQRE